MFKGPGYLFKTYFVLLWRGDHIFHWFRSKMKGRKRKGRRAGGWRKGSDCSDIAVRSSGCHLPSNCWSSYWWGMQRFCIYIFFFRSRAETAVRMVDLVRPRATMSLYMLPLSSSREGTADLMDNPVDMQLGFCIWSSQSSWQSLGKPPLQGRVGWVECHQAGCDEQERKVSWQTL